MTNLPINPVEVQSKVATTIKKMIVVAVLVLIAVVLLALNEYGKGPMAWCFEAKDICTLKAMDTERAARDTFNANLDKQRIDNDNYHNNRINSLKTTLSGQTIVNELSAGRKENVPEGILGFRLVPQAMASETSTGVTLGDVSWSPDGTRYTAVLTAAGSPYATTPIELYCRQAGVTVEQCDILVGICQAESGNGLRYARKDMVTGAIVGADQAGASVYNCAGLKGGGLSYPTPEGWYIRPFKSWDDFWTQFPVIMKAGYFDRGGTTPEVISKCYVKGDCARVKPEWSSRVHDLINKI